MAMRSLGVEDPVGVASGDLIVDVERDLNERLIRCYWTGKSNDRYPSKLLDPLFKALVDSASNGEAAIEMHFEELSHFNSSTITTFIQLIQSTRARGVRLVFLYNECFKWQRVSFEALGIFATEDGWFRIQPVAHQKPSHGD